VGKGWVGRCSYWGGGRKIVAEGHLLTSDPPCGVEKKKKKKKPKKTRTYLEDVKRNSFPARKEERRRPPQTQKEMRPGRHIKGMRSQRISLFFITLGGGKIKGKRRETRKITIREEK